jgi:hypothetical protein
MIEWRGAFDLGTGPPPWHHEASTMQILVLANGLTELRSCSDQLNWQLSTTLGLPTPIKYTPPCLPIASKLSPASPSRCQVLAPA